MNIESKPGGAATETCLGPAFVSAETVDQVLSWEAVIRQLKDAYGRNHSSAAVPPRTMARGNGVWLRALSAVPDGCQFMGTKVFGLSRQRGVNYVITLFDQDTGKVVAFVDGNHVTARRTAGTSAVAVDLLAAPGPATLGVLGSGAEARAHIDAIARVRPIGSAKVFSPSPSRRRQFADDLSKRIGCAIAPVDSAEDAARDASLVVAAARSRDEQPILFGHWLAPEALVVSIGSTLPEQREIDVSVVSACDLIVCDAVDEVTEETGDMLAAATAGLDFRGKLVSLSDVVRGVVAESRLRRGRRMFKSVGTALQDIVIGGLAFERARDAGLVHAMPFGFSLKQA